MACYPSSIQCIQREGDNDDDFGFRVSQVLAPITKLRRTATNSDSPRKFRNRLLQAHDVIHVDEMQYRKWLNTDRSSLERIHQKVGEFVQSFSHCLTPLLWLL